MKLNAKRILLVGIVFFGITVLNTIHDSTTMKILGQDFPHLSNTMKGLIMSIDNIFALFMLPLFGAWSDKCNSKWGKRKPFVFFGTLGACFALLLIPVSLGINSLPLFVIFLCLFLIALGAYRSAGVSIVSDVTIKPLRSKANALINIMGAVGGLLTQQLVVLLFRDPVNGIRPIPLIWMYVASIAIAIIALIIYVLFVNEVKMAKEREALEQELGIEDEIIVVEDKKEKIVLSKSQWSSLILCLVAIGVSMLGYNLFTTFWPAYATSVLHMPDGSFAAPLSFMMIAGIVTVWPVGMIATKIGRKKTICIGFGIAIICAVAGMFAKSSLAITLVITLYGVANSFVIVNTLPMVMEVSTGSTIGKFTGIYYIATQIAMITSPLCGAMFDGFNAAGIGGVEGLGAYFPLIALFYVLALIPLFFAKHGDGKTLKDIEMAKAEAK